MQVPLELSTRGLTEPQAAIARARVEQLVEKLDHHVHGIISCRVAVERPQQHQRYGTPWRVRIEVTLAPNKILVVSREPGQGHVHEELVTAIGDAFRTMDRQLENAVEKRRGDVKHHEPPDETGLVIRLFPEEGYGFIRTELGEEVYFHRNAVTNHAFERLSIGTLVRFVQTLGEKGPQATTVQIVDKPGVRTTARRGEVNPDLPAGWER